MSAKFNVKTIYLVSGYVRMLEIINNIIPASIINLLIKFYYCRSKIAYIVGLRHETITQFPTIIIAQIYEKQHYQCNIKLLDKSQTNETYKAEYDCGICYVEDFPISKYLLQSHRLLVNTSNFSDVIFSVYADSKECGAYIIDKKDTYFWKLPSFKKPSFGQYLTFSKKYGLISIGDWEQNNNLMVLKFDDYYKMKWQNKNINWSKRRYYVPSAMITDDKLICCGGDNYYNNADIYDFITNKMIEQRRFSGIFVDQYIKQRVYVCGGEQAPKKVEYYDAMKNEWILICDTNGQHQKWPIIWNDFNNPNIINIASIQNCKLFERNDIRENKWNYFIKNSNDFNNLFGIQIRKNDNQCRLLFPHTMH